MQRGETRGLQANEFLAVMKPGWRRSGAMDDQQLIAK